MGNTGRLWPHIATHRRNNAMGPQRWERWVSVWGTWKGFVNGRYFCQFHTQAIGDPICPSEHLPSGKSQVLLFFSQGDILERGDEKWPGLLMDALSPSIPLSGQNQGWQWKMRAPNLWFLRGVTVPKTVCISYLLPCNKLLPKFSSLK